MTAAWREDLERRTQSAVMRALGQTPPSRRGLEVRKGNQFDDLCDEKVHLGYYGETLITINMTT